MDAMNNKSISQKLTNSARRSCRKLFSNSKKLDLSSEYEALATSSALKCRVAYNKYGGYCVPLSSHRRPAAQKVLLNDVYEPETIEFMMKNCNSGDIVHAGTYFGDFLPALSKAIAPDAKVWAFEPNPENYRCARITLELNNIQNIALTNAGLGEKEQIMEFQTRDDQGNALGGASRIITDDNSGNKQNTESVQITTIDNKVGPDRHVSILQLDVEGHEKQALTGAFQTIKRCLPIIILEIFPECTLLESDWFSNNILNLGYKKINDLHGNSVFACNR